MSKPDNVLKSADKLFTIVEHLKRDGPKTVTKLSDDLDIPKSTAQVYLNTLYAHNFVSKDNDKYSIGLRFLEYSTYALQNLALYPEVRSKVEELADKTGELAACFVEENGDAVYIYGVEGERSIRTDLSVGERSNLYSTASGKAILAHLSEEQVQEVIAAGLEPRTPNTITDPGELRDELAAIRERGFARSDEESVEGMRAVSAPISLGGRVRGAISLAGPASRFVGERYEKTIPGHLTGAANELELKLTYSESGL